MIHIRPLLTTLISLLLLVIPTLSTIVAHAESSRGKVSVGVLKNWPPHYSLDPQTGRPTGFAVDILEAVARRSQFEIDYQLYNTWTEMVQAFAEKKILIIPNQGITKERQRHFAFTAPVETFRIRCFIRSTTSDIQELKDLAGRLVGVVENNKGRFLMQERGGSRLKIYPSLEQALFGLLAGAVDALIYPETVVQKLANQSGLQGRLKTIDQPLLEIKRAIGVSRDHPELFQKLDAGLNALLQSAEFQTIYARWHGAPKPYWNVRRTALLMSGLLFLSILALSIWRYTSILKLNRSLKKNIEERKLMAAALQASEERYATVVEQASDGVVVLQKGLISFANRTFVDLTGYSLDELQQKSLWELATPEHRDSLRTSYEKRISGGEVSPTYELAIRCKDGREKPMELAASRTQYQGETAIIGIFRDISERKQAEAEKLELKNKLQQAYKMEAIGNLAGGIAHDFNNILGIIIGYTQMAMKTLPTPSKETDKLDKVLTAAGRAKDLVRQILTFSRKQEAEARPVVLGKVVQDALKLLQATIPASIEIQSEIGAEGELALADPTQIHQILINLTTNAVQAMHEKGQLRIALDKVCLSRQELAHRDDMRPGPYLKLTVSDSGHGISADDLERIFEPFFTTKGLDKGTGMGLAMVHGIVSAHHGLITVESEPDSGTSFHIYLPLADSASIDAAQPPDSLQGGKEKILLVDDEPDLAALGQQLLGGLGYDVVVASNSSAALELYRSQPQTFDLLVTDQTMPRLSGLELIEQIHEQTPELPVILCTGHNSKVNNKNLAEFGVSRLLMKPLAGTELAMAVRQVLDAESVPPRAQISR